MVIIEGSRLWALAGEWAPNPFRQGKSRCWRRIKTQKIENEIPVAEIFLSVQGEGINAGVPSVFLRTYFCNLTCTWCDSKYTWLNQDQSKAGVDYKSMTADAVFEHVMRFGCSHLVLTGGEPLLQQKFLAPILSRLKKEGMYIETETNGTIAPTEETLGLIDCFNVSPKTSNSLVDRRVRTRRAPLEAFVASEKAWFKFVVRDSPDLAEVEDLIAEFSIPRDRVMLMPEGIDSTTLIERSRWLVDVCMKRGFRFTPRLHILLFGNKRGT
jgi:7-cyano-7-deazaguanosine (preQ0) biosynthesis protein QueE